MMTGGQPFDRPGNFYEPTVLADIPQRLPAYSRGSSSARGDALSRTYHRRSNRLANDTTFGLGSAVWTDDMAEQSHFIEEIEAGQVFMNAMVVSDPRLPFGGVKHSGYGRELSEFGIREFVNVS